MKILFLSISIVVTTFVYSQTTSEYTPKINIPTSPEAALIGRFGDIPVGYYTGTAGVSIPIYTVKVGGIEVPITLSYHSSGIKVEDQATWVGLGWDLSPEGAIIQEVRGKIDDEDLGTQCTGALNYDLFRQRFNVVQANSYVNLPQWGRSTASNSCLSSYISDPPPGYPYSNSYADPYCAVDELKRGIGQPDIYNFNFGGYSGKFYIHPETHEVVIIDRSEHVFFEKTSINNIKATTLDGTIYNFGVVETANGGIVNEYTGKTYKINSITLITGQTILFEYTENHYSEIAFSEEAEINQFTSYSPPPAPPPPLPVTRSSSMTYHTKKTLSRITTDDVIVDFNVSGREDINLEATDNLKKLSSIDITSRTSNKKVKSVEFVYSYFPYNTVGTPNFTSYNSAYLLSHGDVFGKRLKLDTVREIGYDNNNVAITTKPPYIFEYDMAVTMPLKVSFAKDYWGYYNGEPNQTLLPNLDYFDYFYQPDYKAINQTLAYPYAGGNRNADNTKAGVYMLKKIVYPTGGFTVFDYEPNSFTNQFIPDKSKNVYKNYEVYDNSISASASVQFKLSKATTIHFENRINNGAGNYNSVPPLTYEQMTGCYIKFFKFKFVNGTPQTTLVKQWDLSTVLNVDFQNNGGKLWSEDIRVEFDPDPDPYFVYHVEVYFPDNLNNPLFATIAGVSSHFTFYDDTNVDISESSQCGMRVKTIKNYSYSGDIASDKLIKYYEGKLLNRFRPLQVYKANHLDNSGFSNGVGYEYIAFYNKITASGNDFGTNGGNLIGYGKVEEIELSQGVSNAGKKVYYYLNVENKTQQGCPNIPNLRNGLISKEEVFDKFATRLTEKNYNYTYLQPFPERFIGINVVRLSSGSKVPCNNWYSSTPYTTQYYEGLGQYNGSEHLYNAYTINAEWSKVGSIQTNQFTNGNVISTNESYTYNWYGKIMTVTKTNSSNEQLITKSFYPTDYLIHPYIDNAMIADHNIGTPVIIEQYKGTKLLSKQRTLYGNVASAIHLSPKEIYFQAENYPEERKLTYNQYDNKGNILQYTLENGNPVSFIWDNTQTLIIAKIENATYTQATTAYTTDNNLFRANLPNAFITTYTYSPLVGLTSITDLNNRTTHFEYDNFNRLSIVRDFNNNIIKKICYNYAGQPETCVPQVVYYNIEKSQPFTRNNCGACSQGSQVTYTVPANTYSSTVSPEAANQLAQNDIDANGQNYANTNGTCTANVSISYDNQLFSSGTGYTATYTNLSTNQVYSFTIPGYGTGSLGCLPAGNYRLSVSKPGNTWQILFGTGCMTQSGTSAMFGNVNVSLCNQVTLAIDAQ